MLLVAGGAEIIYGRNLPPNCDCGTRSWSGPAHPGLEATEMPIALLMWRAERPASLRALLGANRATDSKPNRKPQALQGTEGEAARYACRGRAIACEGYFLIPKTLPKPASSFCQPGRYVTRGGPFFSTGQVGDLLSRPLHSSRPRVPWRIALVSSPLTSDPFRLR